MKTWAEIYSKEIEKAGGYKKYLNLKAAEKESLLRRIIKYTSKDGQILEAGCGTGVLSTYLSNLDFNVVAIDIDKEMLDIAQKISKNYPKGPKFERRNLLELSFYPDNYFDVVFSHGVLEHFSNEDIVSILNAELRISKTVIMSVPSNYLSPKDRMFGNERFLSLEKWKTLINKTGGHIVETSSFHYLKGWQRVWDTLIRMKLFGPEPYVTFVLQQRRKDVVS